MAVLDFLVTVYRSVLLGLRRTSPEEEEHAAQAQAAAQAARKREIRRFSYRELKRATRSFSASLRLGKGGFGSVFRGVLRDGRQVAVKRLDSFSLQGEREFQNEILVHRSFLRNNPSPNPNPNPVNSSASTSASPSSPSSSPSSCFVVPLLGYCARGKHTRLLVYECMPNRSLQEALFDKSFLDPLDWPRRFQIILDSARALAFLHLHCNPPVVHGDVKASNILLDHGFSPRITDFGLARLKTEESALWLDGGRALDAHCWPGTPESATTEATTVTTVVTSKRWAGSSRQPRKPTNVRFALDESQHLAPKPAELLIASPCSADRTCARSTPGAAEEEEEEDDDRLTAAKSESEKKSTGKDWWWKQEDSGGNKDYVMQWLRDELKANNLRENQPQLGVPPLPKNPVGVVAAGSEPLDTKNKESKKARMKHRKPREWWKDEYFEELCNKNKGPLKQKAGKGKIWDRFRVKSGGSEVSSYSGEIWRALGTTKKKQQQRYPGGRDYQSGEIGWCKERRDSDYCSRELSFSRRWKSKDGGRKALQGSDLGHFSGDLMSNQWSGELNQSGELVSHDASSTTSVRGTVCYVAPEYGGAGILSEKSDIYSFGVLILVIVSGRRPIQVSTLPMRDFEKANLISWARNLSQIGNMLNLVDERLNGEFDREQASMCITLALWCLQRIPARRPEAAEIVRILSGESPVPALPLELSPSPPSRLHRRKSPMQHPPPLNHSAPLLT